MRTKKELFSLLHGYGVDPEYWDDLMDELAENGLKWDETKDVESKLGVIFRGGIYNETHSR